MFQTVEQDYTYHLIYMIAVYINLINISGDFNLIKFNISPYIHDDT